MSSRNIRDMDYRLQCLYIIFNRKMINAGIDYILTCTYRSNQEQDLLYIQGRKNNKPIVTNAGAGQSPHNCVNEDDKPSARAFDICIVENGKCIWDVKHPHWRDAGKIGLSVGLDWGGAWESFKDFPHFQLQQWKDLRNV